MGWVGLLHTHSASRRFLWLSLIWMNTAFSWCAAAPQGLSPPWTWPGCQRASQPTRPSSPRSWCRLSHGLSGSQLGTPLPCCCSYNLPRNFTLRKGWAPGTPVRLKSADTLAGPVPGLRARIFTSARSPHMRPSVCSPEMLGPGEEGPLRQGQRRRRPGGGLRRRPMELPAVSCSWVREARRP